MRLRESEEMMRRLSKGRHGVQALLRGSNARQHILKLRDTFKNHAGHGCIVAPQCVDHPIPRTESKGARLGGFQAKFASIEKHASVADAVGGEWPIPQRFFAYKRFHHPVNVVVVARYALAAAAQFALLFEPMAQSMQDDDLVEEGPLWIDGGDIRNG